MSGLKNRRSESVDPRASRRGSYIPERKRPSSEERISRGSGFMNRWSGARKSSLNPYDVKRKDTRPLNDKLYQKKKISELVDFLETLEFKYPVTKVKLLSPSKKDFEMIFQFLYNQIEESYEVRKIEEEAPKILKILGYPFNVNKSAFTYAAQTTFPTLLGVLIWMMDIAKYAHKVDIKLVTKEVNSEMSDMHRVAQKYIHDCYYTPGAEPEDTVFTDILKSSLTHNVEELMAENEKRLQEIAEIDKDIKEIESLDEQRQICDARLKKYEEWGIKMKDHYERRNEECELKLAELQLKECELKKLQEEVAVKQEAYDAQGFDGKKQLQYFESQKKELFDKLEKKQLLFKEIQDKYWDTEIQWNQNLDKMKDVSESFGELYNKTVEEITTLLEPLKTMKNSHIKKIISNYSNITSWQDPPPSHTDLWAIEQQKGLEIIKTVTNNIDEVLKRVEISQREKLSELQVKKTELSQKLKLFEAQESIEESDVTSKEKQAVEEVKNLELQNEILRTSVQSLQAEILEMETICKEMGEELKVLEAFRAKIDRELKECIIYHKELFDFCEKKEQEIEEEAMELRNETLGLLRRNI